MPLLLGIDIGTTSVKAGVFDAEGHCLGISRQNYTLQTPAVDYVELDAETYWTATCAAVQQVLVTGDISGDEIGGIGVSSQGETIVPVDSAGNPVYPAIVWLDNRARQQAQQLKENLEQTAYHHTGIPEINPTWPACKIAWLHHNRPQVYKSTAKFLLVQDFIIFRLIGEFVTEGSVACTTLLYDIIEHQWWNQALESIELTGERLPRISKPGEIAGVLTSKSATSLNLRPGIPVIMGGMDQAAGAVGAGNILPEIISETTGGALAIQVTVRNPDIDKSERIPVYVHSVPDRYLLVPVCDTGGMALQWFRDSFCSTEIEKAITDRKNVYDMLTQMAEEALAGSDGLLMLPHLTGAFSPEYNPYARGVFFGFTLYHQKPHFIRAVLEAVAFMLRRNLELIVHAGVKAKELRATGGGAASQLWRQIKADVCQLPVVTLQNHDTAILGDAILAGMAIGMFNTPAEAIQAMVSTAEKVTPIPENIAVYERAYQNYCQLNDTLAPLFIHQFSSVDAKWTG